MRRIVLATTVALLAAPWATAGDEPAKLTVGDKAPPIEITHWVKGEPVKSFEKDKVYVIEFWATWCGPCIKSMPHIGELQEKYKDYGLTVIGVSDEPLSTVVNFLCKTDKKTEQLNFDKIKYTLTTDPDESVKNAYFKAAGQRGIPCSFIVGKDGHVEWIGHPMTMDVPLEKVIFDTWDRQAYLTKWKQEQAFEQEMQKSQEKLYRAMQDEDWDTVMGMLDTMSAKYPDNLSLQWQKFSVLLGQMKQPKRAYAVGHELVKTGWDESGLLNAMAWMIADQAPKENRDLDLALKAAKRADELTKNVDPAVLDTLARVYFEMGDHKKAVMHQRKAATHAGDDAMGEDIRQRLAEYEAAIDG